MNSVSNSNPAREERIGPVGILDINRRVKK
jgi:hypothetical protein